MSNQAKLPLLLELVTNLSEPQKTTWAIEQIAHQSGVEVQKIVVLGLEGAPKVDAVRELIASSQIKAGAGQEIQVFAILNLDQARQETQQVLLKILEEPPSGATFVLTASNLGQILPTVQSRVTLKTLYHYQLDEEKMTRVEQWWQIPDLPSKKYYELIDLTANLLKQQAALMENEYKMYSQNSDKNEHKNYSKDVKIRGKIIKNDLAVKSGKKDSDTDKISDLVAARALLLDLLHFSYYRTLTPITALALKSYRLLTQNVNAKLVIEDLLFSIKNC